MNNILSMVQTKRSSKDWALLKLSPPLRQAYSLKFNPNPTKDQNQVTFSSKQLKERHTTQMVWHLTVCHNNLCIIHNKPNTWIPYKLLNCSKWLPCSMDMISSSWWVCSIHSKWCIITQGTSSRYNRLASSGTMLLGQCKGWVRWWCHSSRWCINHSRRRMWNKL